MCSMCNFVIHEEVDRKNFAVVVWTGFGNALMSRG